MEAGDSMWTVLPVQIFELQPVLEDVFCTLLKGLIVSYREHRLSQS